MANFPTNPTTGDTFHSGTNLYSWTGLAWKMVTGDRPDYGVVTFEGQVYDTPPAVLYHFDGDYTDSSGNDLTATGVNTTFGTSYLVPGFTKTLDFPNTGISSGSAYVSIPDPEIGTSACTIEFWFHTDDDVNQHLFSDGYGTWGNLGVRLYHNVGTGVRQFWLYQSNDNGATIQFYYVDASIPFYHAGATELRHFAIVRAAAVGGNSQWRMYYNGNYLAPASGDGTPVGNWATLDIGGQDHLLGKVPNNPSTPYWFNGQMDEFRISLTDQIYTGTGSYDIPTAPFTVVTKPPAIAGKSQIYAKDVASVTELYMMDGSGTETKLT